MANTYKNAKSKPADTNQATIYTASGCTAIVQAIHIANNDVAADQTVTSLAWTDSSDSNSETKLLAGAVVPMKSALQALDGPLVLEDGDALKITAGAGNKLEVSVSVLEIS